VRRQVCRRVTRRIAELGLGGAEPYRAFLDSHPREWARLDALCRIPISRFFRDRVVFEALGQRVIDELARAALRSGRSTLRAWSAGCASGEEPYSLQLLWSLEAQARHPGVELSILGTDADAHLLRRARRGCYAASSLKELPPVWREQAFRRIDSLYALRPELRRAIRFRCQDIRRRWPDGPFDLVLCRNLVFTYFTPSVQLELLGRIRERLVPGGILIVGAHEALPEGARGFAPAGPPKGLYRRA
jgi:chemotaxis protein methyltransferase CheR